MMPFYVACRSGDDALKDDGIMPDVLPVLPGCGAEMDDVCAGEVFAKHGQQLILREQAGEWRGSGMRHSGYAQARLPHDVDGDGA